MIRDITIGQYYPADSVIHRLDPRMKIVGTLIYMISLFCLENLPGYLLVTVFFAITVYLSKVPFRFMIKGLRPVVFLLVFTAGLTVFWTPGEILWKWGVVSISIEGIWRAVYMALRLVFLVIGSSVLTLTTTPNQLTDGLEQLLHPLNKIHAPVHEVAMMMSIALRFIPILIEEMDKIMKAQMSRGADFESGNLFQRMKNMLPLLVPLFVSATRRANELAYAMDARCYHGGEGRTKMKPLKYAKRDAKGYLVIFVYIVLLVAVSVISGKLMR